MRHENRNRLWLCAAVALFAVGAGGQEIPRPHEKLAPPPPPPAVEPSAVVLPVSVSLESLAGALAKGFPAELGEEEKWLDGAAIAGKPGFEYQYRLWRGTPALEAAGDRILISFPEMKYRLRGRIDLGASSAGGGCGYEGGPRRLRLRASVQLDWSPDGALRSRTAFDPAQFTDPCKLSPFDVDVTPLLKKALDSRLPAMAAELDKAVREQSVSREGLAELWRWLQKPAELEPGLWLTLNPIGIGAAPIRSEGGKALGTALWLDLEPKAVAGQRPAAGEKALPAVRKAPETAGVCHIALPIRVPYARLDRALEEQLVGTQVDASPLGSVEVVSVRSYGSGDRLILELGIEGILNGTIYAAGRPVFEQKTATLRMEDFDLTIDTENVLANTAMSVARDQIVAVLEPEARVNLKDTIEEFRRSIERRLTGEVAPGVRMEGSDVRLTPRGVYPISEGVEIQIVADATLRLIVK